jgi:hypothetical protein
MKFFSRRKLGADILNLADQVSIYNNVVATYHWRDDYKVGIEIVSNSYADTQRQIFEHYWQLASGEQH